MNHIKVYCFGNNFYYQCGVKYKKNVLMPEIMNELIDLEVIDIKCGFHHNSVCTKDKQYYLFGDNQYNQCLVSVEEYVKIPTKYNALELGKQYKIIDIYPGHKETRVVTQTI